jgi:outer membrane protein assembly factor BamB
MPDFEQEIQRYMPTDEYVLETYISPEGDFAAILAPTRFYLLGANGEVLVDRELSTKSVQSVRGQSGGILPEQGSAFMVMPEAGKIVLLDWTVRDQDIEVYDVTTGNSLWTTSDYRYTNTDSEMGEKMAMDALGGLLESKTDMNVEEVENELRMDHFVADTAGVFMTRQAISILAPAESTDGFLLRIEEGQAMFDASTGEKRWEYTDFPLVVGAYLELPDRGEIVLYNRNDNVTGENSSKNTTIILNLETGEERLRVEPVDPVYTGYMKERDGLLMLDFENFTAYDLETGETVIQTSTPVEQSKAGQFLSSQQDVGIDYLWESPGINSLVTDSHIYTAYMKSGESVYPASRSLGSKNNIAKYDLQTGEQLWEAENVLDGLQAIPSEGGDYVFAKKVGWSKQVWYALDRQTGEVAKEVDLDKGMSVWKEGIVMLAGKKELQIYNYDDLNTPARIHDYKELQTDDVEFLYDLSPGAFGVGKEGVLWLDDYGQIQEQLFTDKVETHFVADDYAVIVNKKLIKVIDLQEQYVVGQVEHKYDDREDIILFDSESGKLMIIDDKTVLRGYTMK